MNKEASRELIKKYNEGKASVEEIRLVENWFVHQSNIYQQDPQDLDYLKVKQQMWINIAAKVVPAAPVRKPIWSFNIAAAAAVALISIAAVFFYVNHKYADAPQIVQNDINPGKNKAILTLADGRKISLTDAVNGQLASDAGVTISKTADGQLIYQAAASTSNKSSTAYNTVEAPRGGQWQVVLPDGSKVFLNALSSLKYPVSFSAKERKVELKGEAYFEISHNKKSPFKVVAKGQTVEVLGTHFNIMAYPDEQLIKTTLLTGSVKVSAEKESLTLKPGEQAQVSPRDMKLIQNVDLEDVMAWKKGYFKFSENLESVMAKVSRWYDVDVSYEGQPDPEFKYKGEISRNKNLSEVLNMLEYTGNLHFKVEGRRVIVKK
ncbi:FecR family protein [Pedobacter sp. ok626]|uniref:FecR family protein n=1 Tax=Pedobacter sp. ok626 TaxID=1761882 RepID=UPI0008826020|nr:FecR family protein [Pedobacter sp. ok626]SDJ03173.1 FecR family protein [Pedobacter sp. ok626]